MESQRKRERERSRARGERDQQCETSNAPPRRHDCHSGSGLARRLPSGPKADTYSHPVSESEEGLEHQHPDPVPVPDLAQHARRRTQDARRETTRALHQAPTDFLYLSAKEDHG